MSNIFSSSNKLSSRTQQIHLDASGFPACQNINFDVLRKHQEGSGLQSSACLTRSQLAAEEVFWKKLSQKGTSRQPPVAASRPVWTSRKIPLMRSHCLGPQRYHCEQDDEHMRVQAIRAL